MHITMLTLCASQGYAVKVGMMVGRGELLLFMDADGATRVSDIEKLEAALAAVSESGSLSTCTGRTPKATLKGVRMLHAAPCLSVPVNCCMYEQGRQG